MPYEPLTDELVTEKLHELVEDLGTDGLHLHLVQFAGLWRWATTARNTDLCHTPRCFYLKLKGLKPNDNTPSK